MSFRHTNSSKSLKSKLDLFSLLPTQTSIENLQWIYYKRITSLADDASIKFVIPGHKKDYLDLTHTMLSLRIRVEISFILGAASTIPASAIKIDPINHLLRPIFK